MKVEQVYVYPIKSLRPVKPSSAHLTYQGFHYDRRFMLINPASKKPNMHISDYAEMSLFHPSITPPSPSNPQGSILVTFKPPKASERSSSQIIIPLEPDTSTLTPTSVTMHFSSCQAYDMGSHFNSWFSDLFTFPVRLLYIGSNHRSVRGNISPAYNTQTTSLFSSISSTLSSYYTGSSSTSTTAVDKGISFHDRAPLLIVSTASLANVNTHLPPNDPMLIEKFRPNIVLSGPELEAWEEDFWSDLEFQRQAPTTTTQPLKVKLTANCARCTSVNVDFKTGNPGKGESGSVLKKMSRYRRVDEGNKWSPIFGRYAFIMPMDGGEGEVRVGDEVVVTKRNEVRDKWYWPGAGSAA